MRSHIAGFVIALVLGTASVAAAQVIPVDRGTVVRIDPQSSVIVLDDGRMYRATSSTVFLVENRPATLGTLRPGERVVIQGGEPVIYRDGRYVVLPPLPVVAQSPIGVKQTIYGTIDDVDRNGKVKIKTDRDSFETRLSAEAVRQLRKGDTVIIDMTFTQPGIPSALPR
jgi:preprotein translocase subunit YajC